MKNDLLEFKNLRTVAEKGGCFVAGTLVHTRGGLVPIETIRPGDWVLSQPEDQGELTCKQVVNTFQYENKAIWIVSYVPDQTSTVEHLAVTGFHPFWIKGQGWTRADKLNADSILELTDGRSAAIYAVREIYQTHEEGIGWAEDLIGANVRLSYSNGGLVDLRNGPPVVDYAAASVPLEGPSDATTNWGVAHLATRVYNIEVECFHTYYVGNSGVWVHNKDCTGSGQGD